MILAALPFGFSALIFYIARFVNIFAFQATPQKIVQWARSGDLTGHSMGPLLPSQWFRNPSSDMLKQEKGGYDTYV